MSDECAVSSGSVAVALHCNHINLHYRLNACACLGTGWCSCSMRSKTWSTCTWWWSSCRAATWRTCWATRTSTRRRPSSTSPSPRSPSTRSTSSVSYIAIRISSSPAALLIADASHDSDALMYFSFECFVQYTRMYIYSKLVEFIGRSCLFTFECLNLSVILCHVNGDACVRCLCSVRAPRHQAGQHAHRLARPFEARRLRHVHSLTKGRLHQVRHSRWHSRFVLHLRAKLTSTVQCRLFYIYSYKHNRGFSLAFKNC